MKTSIKLRTRAAVIAAAVGVTAAGTAACGVGSAPGATPTLVNRITPGPDGPATTNRGTPGPNFTPPADALTPSFSGTPPAGGRPGGQQGSAPGGAPRVQASFNTPIAEFLGISEDELAAALQEEGATLASVAEAYGKSRDDVKTFLIDDAKARLAAEVAARNITQEEADQQIARLESDIDRLLDSSGGPVMSAPPPGQ